MTLDQLHRGRAATVAAVDALGFEDPVARRLRVLGFVAGEPVRMVGAGPLGGDPLLVQVGQTRFALRRSEAGRIRIVTG
jgi:ferrous iron transport protein A